MSSGTQIRGLRRQATIRLVLVMLVVRPNGLFGEKLRKKV